MPPSPLPPDRVRALRISLYLMAGVLVVANLGVGAATGDWLDAAAALGLVAIGFALAVVWIDRQGWLTTASQSESRRRHAIRLCATSTALWTTAIIGGGLGLVEGTAVFVIVGLGAATGIAAAAGALWLAASSD